MDSIYRHRQRATLILWCLIPGALVMLLLGLHPSAPVVGRVIVFSVAGLLALCAWLFHSMTVTVSERSVEVRFGPGFIRKCWPLGDFASAAIVSNRWWYGWGIHLLPRGWLYNVSGLHAVELTRPNGRVLRIGTNDAEALAAALREGIALSQKPTPEPPRLAGPETS